MEIPGADILSIAFNAISTQTVSYIKYLDRVDNDAGVYVNLYDEPIDIQGSFQPTPRSVYLAEGLDFQKSYFTLWAEVNFLDVGRDVAGDMIEVNGRAYQCESATPWFTIDGWSEIRCVDVGAAEKFGFGSGFGIFGA